MGAAPDFVAPPPGDRLAIQLGANRNAIYSTAIHLQSGPGCRGDHDGLLEAARRFADVKPE